MERLITTVGKASRVDLEAVEQALRAALMHLGCELLEKMLEPVGRGRTDQAVLCQCKTRMCSQGVREKKLLTLLGPIRFRRSLFLCPACGRTRYPGDEELDCANASRSPGVRRLQAHFGHKEPFKEAAKDIAMAAGITLCAKDAERVAEKVGEEIAQWEAKEHRRLRRQEPPPPEAPKTIETFYTVFDGTGVPMIEDEVQGRKGKQPDGSAKTREAKPGCVFTQTTLDDKGRPIRDPASTSFTGAIENAATFGWRMYAEAVRRGMFRAKRAVVLRDGAEWTRNLAQTHFPNAIDILDLYHAREHISQLCRYLFDRDIKRLNQHRDAWWELLDEGAVEEIIAQANARLPRDTNANKDARREIRYLEKNMEQMRYKKFREQGLFVGSGVIEAGCKTVVGQRLKQSGMEWSVRGANAIIALRCNILSNRHEEFWEQRAG